MRRLNYLLRYLRFIFLSHSRKGHTIHSLFVHKLVPDVFLGNSDEFYRQSLKWRKMMNRDKTIIDTNVYGAGSTVNTGNSLPAGKLARISGIPHKYGRLFYDMCRKYKPATIIELGTGLGISTYYLAKGNPDSSVITVEGSFEKTNYAKSMLENEGISNVKFFTGNFDELTEMTTSYISHPLLVFIDGNHTYEPTVRYFNFYLQYAKENTIIIFDDIHWSDEMEKAWKLISNHEKVSISIDLFRCGIVFFGKKYPEGIF